MKLLKRCSVFVAAVTLLAGGLTLASPQVESASAGVVGGLDLNAYCKQQYGSGYHVALYWNNVNGWKCVSGRSVEGVYFSRACSFRYGTWKYGWNDFYNPYTVFCYT